VRKKKRRLNSSERKSVNLNIYYNTFIEKRRQEAAPARIGRKKKKRGVEASTKLP